MYAGISLISIVMTSPGLFQKTFTNITNVELGSTFIEQKRNNELFFYSTALSIQSYAAFSMVFFPKAQNISKIIVPVIVLGYLT